MANKLKFVTASGSVTFTTDETSKTVVTSLSRLQGVFQASITGTQTVTLQGRIDDTHDWVDILSTSTDEASLITLLPELRVVTSATSGGSSVNSVVQ